MSADLHIISFDVPYPPNYGGVIDVFFKIKALSEQGVRIHLHCFLYGGKSPAPELQQWCRSVYYYPRRLNFTDFFNTRPFIIQTRRPPDLLERLSRHRFPILFEGLHSAAFVDHPALKDHFKIIRMHNVEWQYYGHLAGLEKQLQRKTYLWSESLKLRFFEPKVLPHADLLLPISPADYSYFVRQSQTPSRLLTAFHGYDDKRPLGGKGKFALFHGNLSVTDNERAARFLISKVFRKLDYPVVIAGLAPSRNFRTFCAAHPAVTLVESPSEEEMERLMQQAHIHLLYTFQADGMKIKLLRSLFTGRFVIANTRMVEQTGLENLCHLAETPEAIEQQIRTLAGQALSNDAIAGRAKFLQKHYSDRQGAQMIMELLSEHTG